MIKEEIEKLKKRIANKRLEDDDDLCIYMKYASRLAALGDNSEFEKIKEITERPLFKGRLEDILIDRCRTILWDIDEQMGEELAFTLIDAQDFWCFYQRAREPFSLTQRVCSWFETIMEEASIIPIDEETAEILTQFTDTWPLAEEDQLAPVAAPLTPQDYELLSRIPERYTQQEITGIWTSPSRTDCWATTKKTDRPVPINDLVLACDDGEPSEQLLRNQDQLFWEGETAIGQIKVVRQLNSSWKLLLYITKVDGTVPAVDSVRTGFFGAVRDQDKPSRWIYNLKPFDRDFRRLLLEEPIVIRLSQGIVLKLSFNRNHQ